MNAAKKELLLGIDVGTTLIKSVLFDTEGHLVAKSSASVELEHPVPGWAEQDMDSVWEAASKTIRECAEVSKTAGSEIAGVSVSGQGGGMWLIDQQGRPVRKGITWLDGRSGTACNDWETSGLLTEIDDFTGYHTFPGVGPLTLFHWFKDNDPNILKAGYKNLWAKDWIKFMLTGIAATDETDPSNGHFKRGERTFSRELFKMLGIEKYWNLLPEIIPSWQVMGKVTKAAADLTGLKIGTPVASGAWDVSSTSLGAGCVDEGQALSILGTGGIHLAVSSFAPDAKGERYSICNHCVPDRWVINSMAMTATANLDWFIREHCQADKSEADTTGRNIFEVINEKVGASTIGANGILFLPFLQGERAPFLKTTARGVFFGMTDASRRGDMLRSIFEGVAFSTRHNYETVERAIPINEVVLAGGGSKSKQWSQIISDCTNKPMHIVAGEEFGALGAAFNAGVGVGLYSNHNEAVSKLTVARNHVPDLEANAAYTKYYSAYKNLIEAVWNLWDQMAAI